MTRTKEYSTVLVAMMWHFHFDIPETSSVHLHIDVNVSADSENTLGITYLERESSSGIKSPKRFPIENFPHIDSEFTGTKYGG